MNYILDYKVIRVLEETEYSIIIKVLNETNNRFYALKLEPEENIIIKSNYDTNLNHPNVIKCYDIIRNFLYKDNQYKIFILEWANMGDLRNKIKEFSYEEKKIVFRDILLGLNYLHEKKIFHRDIKPENIFFSYCEKRKRNIAKIADYDTLFSLESYVTPEYSPPQWREKGCEKFDIWSIGCLFYEMFFLTTPFGSRQLGYSIEDILNNVKSSPINKKILSLSSLDRFIIFKCLRKEPSKRFKSIKDLLDCIDNPTILKRFFFNRTIFLGILSKEIC